MNLLTGLTLLLLFGNANGFFGIGRFFRSASNAAESVSRVIQEQGAALNDLMRNNIAPNIDKMVTVTTECATEFVGTTKQLAHTINTTLFNVHNMLQNDVVPEIKRTGEELRRSMSKIVQSAERLETRVRLSLDKFDETVQNIGKNVNHAVDIIIVVCCLLLFSVCHYICNNCNHAHVTYEFLFLLTIFSLITGVAVLLRMFLTGVLLMELSSADTVKYCVMYPSAFVAVWKALQFGYRLCCRVSVVISFFFQLPGLFIYITISGPILWTWRAYKYSFISRSQKAFLVSIAVPWNTIAIWFLVFSLIIGISKDYNQTGYFFGLFAAYVYFRSTASYLYRNHQRPTEKKQLRNMYAKRPDTDKVNTQRGACGECKESTMKTDNTTLRRLKYKQ